MLKGTRPFHQRKNIYSPSFKALMLPLLLKLFIFFFGENVLHLIKP